MIIESKFYNTKSAKTGDVITFVDEAKEVPTKFGIKTQVNIEVHGKQKQYTMNGKAVSAMVKAFGQDTSDWVNQKAKVFIDDSTNFPSIKLSPIIPDVDLNKPPF